MIDAGQPLSLMNGLLNHQSSGSTMLCAQKNIAWREEKQVESVSWMLGTDYLLLPSTIAAVFP